MRVNGIFSTKLFVRLACDQLYHKATLFYSELQLEYLINSCGVCGNTIFHAMGPPNCSQHILHFAKCIGVCLG